MGGGGLLGAGGSVDGCTGSRADRITPVATRLQAQSRVRVPHLSRPPPVRSRESAARLDARRDAPDTTRRHPVLKRLLLIVAMGAALAACNPSTPARPSTVVERRRRPTRSSLVAPRTCSRSRRPRRRHDHPGGLVMNDDSDHRPTQPADAPSPVDDEGAEAPDEARAVQRRSGLPRLVAQGRPGFADRGRHRGAREAPLASLGPAASVAGPSATLGGVTRPGTPARARLVHHVRRARGRRQDHPGGSCAPRRSRPGVSTCSSPASRAARGSASASARSSSPGPAPAAAARRRRPTPCCSTPPAASS